MNLDIERAVKFPMEDDDWIKTVGIGGVLILLSFFIVPALAAYGYVLRAIRSGIDDDAEPPVFDEWGELIIDGLKMLVIGFVYQLPALIVLVVLVGGSLFSLLAGAGAGGSGGSAAAGLGLAGIFGGIAIYGLLALVLSYIGVAGIINFARTGEIGDAFDVDTIKQLVFSGDYLVAWGVVIGLNFAVNIVVSIVSTVTFGIGGLLAPWPLFYVLVASGFIWGRSYTETMGTETTAP
jgi:hypothetical protein